MTVDEKIAEILRRVRKHPEYLPFILAEFQEEHPAEKRRKEVNADAGNPIHG